MQRTALGRLSQSRQVLARDVSAVSLLPLLPRRNLFASLPMAGPVCLLTRPAAWQKRNRGRPVGRAAERHSNGHLEDTPGPKVLLPASLPDLTTAGTPSDASPSRCSCQPITPAPRFPWHGQTHLQYATDLHPPQRFSCSGSAPHAAQRARRWGPGGGASVMAAQRAGAAQEARSERASEGWHG